MIALSNGHRFEFACGAGALGFDGGGWWWEHPLRWLGVIDTRAFTVVSKTVTLEPRKGRLSMWHPWTCVSLLPYGTANSVGLTNPGILSWVEDCFPRRTTPFAASIEAASFEEAFALGSHLAPLDLAFVEINASCPNLGQEATPVYRVLKGFQSACRNHPIVVKLSLSQAMNTEILRRLNDSPRVEAIHAINAVPWDRVFPGSVSPIERYHPGIKGGVSGRYIHHLAREAVRNVREHAPNKPVMAGGGIESIEQVRAFRQDGAQAFSIGTLFLRRPWRPNRIIRQWESENRQADRLL